MTRPDPAEQSRSRRERILDAAFHAFADARLPRHGRGRHRRRRRDVEGRHLLPLPDQGSDLPRAHGDDRRQAGRAGRAGGRARDRAGRPRRGGDPHGAHDVRRPSDDGAAAVPRHDGRRARVPGRDERPPRAVRDADPGLSRRRRGGRRRSRRWTPGSRASPGSARSTRSWPGGCSPSDAAPARGRISGAPRDRCCDRSACPRPGSARCRCPPRRGLPTFPESRDDRGPAGDRDPRPALRGAGAGQRLAALLDEPSTTTDTRARLRHAAGARRSTRLAVRRRRRGGLEAALWLRPSEGTAFVGIGRAWATEPAGDGRFHDAEAAWRALLSDARLDRPTDGVRGTGPCCSAAIGLHRARAGGGRRWAPFGAARSSCPQLALAQRAALARPSRRPRRRRR